MNVIEALEAGKIRYSRGVKFSATLKPGYYVHPENLAELSEFVSADAAKYVGSVFVKFTDDLPAEVPLNSPEHCWAEAVFIGPNYEYTGAIVTWSTDEKEAAHRATWQSQNLSFDEFNVRRHGNV